MFNLLRFDVYMIYLYKIVHSLIDSPELLSLVSFNIKFRARKSNETNLFALLIYKNNISFYNPLTRMARQYNDIAKNNIQLDIFCSKLCQYKAHIKGVLHPKVPDVH